MLSFLGKQLQLLCVMCICALCKKEKGTLVDLMPHSIHAPLQVCKKVGAYLAAVCLPCLKGKESLQHLSLRLGNQKPFRSPYQNCTFLALCCLVESGGRSHECLPGEQGRKWTDILTTFLADWICPETHIICQVKQDIGTNVLLLTQ